MILQKIGGNYIEVSKHRAGKGYELNFNINENIIGYGLNKHMLKSFFDLVFGFVKKHNTQEKVFYTQTDLSLSSEKNNFYKYFDRFNDKNDPLFKDMFKKRFSRFPFPTQEGNKVCPRDKIDGDAKLIAIYDYEIGQYHNTCRKITSILLKRHNTIKNEIINQLNENDSWFAYAYFMYEFFQTEYGFRQNDARNIFHIKMHSFYTNVMKHVNIPHLDSYFLLKV